MIETRVRGIPFWVHEDEALSNAIRRDQEFWEGEILDYMRDNYQDQQVILDIGANIGNHTVYFATYFNYRKILAFEPAVANFAVLKKNIERFDQSKILLYPQGLSDEAQWITLVHDRSNWGAHALSKVTESEMDFERVYVNTVDEVMKWYYPRAVSLMKIDVEWWEPQVLQGAKKTIERDHPLILIEDTKNEYSKLLPDYEIIQAWEHHNTYLYKWKEE